MNALVSVAPAPLFELGEVRHVQVGSNLTLSEIAAEALPGLPPNERSLRVLLVSDDDVAVVHPEYWHRVRPKPGVRVVLRLVATGDDALRAVLTVVVSVAAMALGQFWATAIVPTAGIAQTAVAGLITSGLTVVGTMLLNALIPIQSPDKRDARGDGFSINGWQNRARPGEPVAWLSGRRRMAPDFVGMPYTTIFGDDRYVTALLSFGYGPLQISDIKIGETPIEEFDNVEIQLREGLPDDDPVTVYPKQVLEQSEGVELKRPKVDGVWEDRPVVRQTASNATEAAIIFAFPAGLFNVNSEGDVKPTSVRIRIRQRLVGDTSWSTVVELDIRNKLQRPFFRQYRWSLPQRGRWEIEVLKLTNDDGNATISRQVNLASIQSFRPEYPINFETPLALLGIRIKATDQLSGNLDTINAIAHRRALDWTGSEWQEGLSRNPAAAYRDALQGPQHPFPVPDAEIDLEQLQDWHEWCAEKGLKYDRLHTDPISLGEMLLEICAAGRATPRHDGVRWGVVIDRPSDEIVDHISPRNTSQFRWTQTYFDPPDAFTVSFLDETNDWSPAERTVPWPGHSGSIDLVEELPMPGKTDPDEIWIEARRQQYVLQHRATSYTAVQDAGARVATRGDTLSAAFGVLDRFQVAARVRRVDGLLVELDEEITMEQGTRYALRYRVWADDEDSRGTSTLVELRWRDGTSNAVLLPPDSIPPRVGHVVLFGPLSNESIAVKVRGIEPGTGFSQVIHMVPAAPEIDALTDAEVPPEWDSAVGDEIDLDSIAPGVPIISYFDSTPTYEVFDPSDDTSTQFFDVTLGLEPEAGETVPLAGYDVEHKVAPDAFWTLTYIPAGQGAFGLEDVEHFAEFTFRIRAVAEDGTRSLYSPEYIYTAGADYAVPDAVDPDGVAIDGALGHAVIEVAISSADAKFLRLYRVPAGVDLDPLSHAVGDPVPVMHGITYTLVDGDGTRQNRLGNADFGLVTEWTAGGGWSISSGRATHTPGSISRIEQTLSGLSGIQRIAFTVSDRTAGSVRAVLTGTTEVAGSAVTADGLVTLSLDTSSGSGLSGFAIEASADFDGSIDDVVLFTETPACVQAGTYDFYVGVSTGFEIAGTFTGPFTKQIL